jgi:SAM-dependent methyltransferase
MLSRAAATGGEEQGAAHLGRPCGVRSCIPTKLLKASLPLASSWSMPVGSGDRWPEDYERGRPGWPPAVLDIPGLPPASTVLELAAGTGKLTRLLVSTFEHVVAVEPAKEMRRLLVTHCAEAEVLDGTAEAIPLADSSVDAVFAAEAFHKFDDHRALAQIAGILRPRGALVLMWNIPAGPWKPPITAVEQLLTERGPDPSEVSYDLLDLDGPNYTSGGWRRAFANSPFAPIQEARLPNPQRLDRDGLVAFLASMGWLADLPDADRLPLLDEVRALLDAAEYQRLWETHVHWTRLANGRPR